MFFLLAFTFVMLYFIQSSTCGIEKFVTNPQYLNHKTKSFSAEKDMIERCGPDCAWKSQPAKSFDAEREGVRQAQDISGGFIGKTMKYY